MRLVKCMSCGTLVVALCSSWVLGQAPKPGTMFFAGARLIVGDGSPPIENGAFIVTNTRIAWVGKAADAKPPSDATRIDVTGKTVIPALIDMHSHLGYTAVKTSSTAAANFTRDNLIDHLKRYAYYGIAATLSMGVDRGDLAYQLRASPAPRAALFLTAGRGIALPNAGPGAEYRKDAAYGVTNEAEARKAVLELAARKVDVVKIWVDDRSGTVPKLPPPLYRAIIDEAHKHTLRVAAHIFDLADAKELLRSGIDGFAHGVRDKDVDDELIGLFKQHPNVFVIPNLPDRGAKAEDLPWLSETLPAPEIARLRDQIASRRPEAAQEAQRVFGIQARNLARLNKAGVRIGFGTDAGVSVGWTGITELEDMVEAGMTPAQVIVAATRTGAESLKLNQLGMVAVGKSADFIVLDANPLDAISNVRRVAKVYLRGQEIDRAALRAAFTN